MSPLCSTPSPSLVSTSRGDAKHCTARYPRHCSLPRLADGREYDPCTGSVFGWGQHGSEGKRDQDGLPPACFRGCSLCPDGTELEAPVPAGRRQTSVGLLVAIGNAWARASAGLHRSPRLARPRLASWPITLPAERCDASSLRFAGGNYWHSVGEQLGRLDVVLLGHAMASRVACVGQRRPARTPAGRVVKA